MTLDINEAVKNYLDKPSKTNNDVLNEFLFNEILNAVKGKKSCSKFGRKYNFINHNSASPHPDEIELWGTKKDFSEAILTLFGYFESKIKHGHDVTINIFNKKEEDRKKWILSSLGLVLNNEVFKDENNTYKKSKHEVISKIKKRFFPYDNDNIFKNKERIIKDNLDLFNEDIKRSLSVIDNVEVALAYWIISIKSSNKNHLLTWMKEKGIRNDDFKHRAKEVENLIIKYLIKNSNKKVSLDDTSKQKIKKNIEEYEFDRFDELTDSCIDILKGQKSAFFWIPGYMFKEYNLDSTKDIKLEGNRSDKSMYIGFFYAWLRQCSFATFGEIAKEACVTSPSTVSRNWQAHEALAKLFPVNTDIFCSVYFSETVRDSIGIFDNNIRCYKKKNYDTADYKNKVLPCKKLLWTIYADILINHDCIDDIELKEHNQNEGQVFENNNLKIVYEYTSNENLGIHAKKRYFLIYIKEIKYMEDSNEDTSK